MKSFYISAIMLLMAATGAPAQQVGTADQAAQSGTAAAPAKKPRKICREDPTTGSLFKKQVCKTQVEWDAEAQAAKDKMDDWGRQSGARYSGGGNDGGGGARSGVGIGGM